MSKPRDTVTETKTYQLIPPKGEYPPPTTETSLVIYDKHMYMFGGETESDQSSEIYKFSFGLFFMFLVFLNMITHSFAVLIFD